MPNESKVNFIKIMEADSWIQKLPDEVLIYILTLISPYQDLHSAAQVCRQWRHCVHQVVYQRKSNFTKAVNQMKLLWTKSECNNDTKKPLISRRYSHSGMQKFIIVHALCGRASKISIEIMKISFPSRQGIKKIS